MTYLVTAPNREQIPCTQNPRTSEYTPVVSTYDPTTGEGIAQMPFSLNEHDLRNGWQVEVQS